jgi:hypothetical protein
MEYEIHNTQYLILNTTYFKFMSIENPTLAHFSTLFTNLPSTSVENLLQIRSIITNKPNSPIVHLNLTLFIAMNYTIYTCLTKVKNKPNSNPIKPNLYSVFCLLCSVFQYKPNSSLSPNVAVGDQIEMVLIRLDNNLFNSYIGHTKLYVEKC